jgi:hypothetical protein
MLSAKKARQRPLIVSGGDRICGKRFGMFEVKYQPKVDQCSLGADSVPESFTDPSILHTTRRKKGLKASGHVEAKTHTD